MLCIKEKKVHIIFMDPRCKCGHDKKVLAMLRGLRYVTEKTMIIVEASLETDFSYLEELGFFIVKDKHYKTNRHVFIQRIAE